MVLINDKKVTLEDLSNQFLVSKTSLYQNLGVINKILELFNTKLKVTNNGIITSGTEIDLQKSIKNNIFENSNDGSLFLRNKLDVLFDKDILDQIFNLLLDDYSELTNNVSIYYMKSIIVVLLVQISRLQHDYHVELEETF